MTEFFKGATKFAGKAALATAGLAIATAAIGSSSASAASFTLNVASTTEPGATYTLIDALDAADLFDYTAEGQVAANDQGLAFANAAGNATNGGNTGGSIGTSPVAALLVSADGTNFFSLFDPATSGNGTAISGNSTIGAIFGGGLAAGTTLSFKVNDYTGNYSDNLGSFTFVGNTTAANTTAVPEPFTVIGTLIGGTAAARMRKKLNSSK